MDAVTHALLSALGTLLAAGVSRHWRLTQMWTRTTYTVRVVS